MASNNDDTTLSQNDKEVSGEGESHPHSDDNSDNDKVPESRESDADADKIAERHILDDVQASIEDPASRADAA